MDIQEIRNQFPYLKTGKIYFNHAAVSPLPTYVTEKVNHYIFERSETEINNHKAGLENIANLKNQLSNLLNTEPERIAFTKSVTDSLNILAQGIDWKPGDRIILNDIEFPANVYPFLNLKEYGVEIDFVKSQNGSVLIEDIEKLITPRTRLLSISFVQFLTGFRADLKSIGELCENNNIIFCVDAIQGAGVVELDVADMKIDFLAGGSHKWMMGLMGVGYLFVTKELQDRIAQKTTGWLSVEDEWNLLDYQLKYRSDADRFHTGTYSMIGITALNASMEFFKIVGFEIIEKLILDNTEYFISELNEIGINQMMQNSNRSNLAGIVTFTMENSEDVFKRLVEKNIVGSLREGMIRFSPHFYNTKEEIDVVIEELK
ncbi:MAG: aminotransferase class V-fold PLP-dependent enzyme [Ignavibacteriae bacterium]|nr:aminotransferase class V-fold PLP-dependent enzyme [Ignavibacteriota bacterium]